MVESDVVTDCEYSPVQDIPSMTPTCVHRYLEELGEDWLNWGHAVECGAWLGATSVALAEGLQSANYDLPYHAYDRWKANGEEVTKALRQGTSIRPGQDLQPLWEDNMSGYSFPVRPRKLMRLREAEWCGGPIEIFLLDAAKSNPGFRRVMDTFGPHFIPGVTTFGLLDYYFYRKYDDAQREHYRCQKKWVEDNAKSLVKVRDWPDECSCAFFRYQGGIWS